MKKIRKPSVGFIGQGFVGKNLANNLERRGYRPVRYSLELPYSVNKEKIKECDLVFIAVPTPTTPQGFSDSVLIKVLPLVGKGKTAVIKSTIVPGETQKLQKKFPQITILHSPEFLSEATAVGDTDHPFSNIIGMPIKDRKHRRAASQVLGLLPKASFSEIISSNESEIIKYAHNCNGFMHIVFFNLVYDLTLKSGSEWRNIEKAIKMDPYIASRYASPLHKSGRGAGGHCFIKDFAAFKQAYKEILSTDRLGLAVLEAVERKNIKLLLDSRKDLDLLEGVYGKNILKKKKK